MAHGVRHGRCRRDRDRLAQTLCACEVRLGVRKVHSMGCHVRRNIEGRGNLVIVPVPVHHLPGLGSIEYSLLAHREPDAHGDAAVDLAVETHAVHHSAALVAADETQNLYLAGLYVHFDLAELRGKGVHDLVCRVLTPVADADDEAAFFERGKVCYLDLLRGVGCDCDGVAFEGEVRGLCFQVLGRHGEELLFHVKARGPDGG